MNTPANTVPASLDAHSISSPGFSMTRPFYWSVQRELWENRSIYIAPLAAAALFLIAFVVSPHMDLPRQMRALSNLDAAHQQQTIILPYDFIAGLLMLTGMVVGLFYCLDALNGERRDRSILFWKSLPVSDTTAVLAKASIPFVVLPLIIFAVTVATQWIILLLSSAVLLGSGMSAGPLWTRVQLVPMSLMLLYHLITVHVLWHAPFYGWLLLISAWARRAAFLWATLPILAIAFVEKIAFNTSHFATFLGDRLGGGAEAMTMPGSMPIHPGVHITFARYLSTPGLWIGLAFTAICLAAAVQFRRYRNPV
ncbi:MAG TPA: ABC transporter permease [Acidobacteriaceae bacterium]